MNPGKKYSDSYLLSALKGNDMIVIRSDAEYTVPQLEAIKNGFKKENPEWTGGMIVLRTDQMIEKMPEETARALYQALKGVFEPPAT